MFLFSQKGTMKLQSNNTDSIQYPSAAHDEALLDTLDSMFINEKLTPSQSQPQIDPRDRVNNQNG